MSINNKFIIDTNTLISSLLIKNSIPFKVLEKARTQGLLIFSEDTFFEFELVLLRSKFDRYFSKEERLQIIERMHIEASFVAVVSDLMLSRDAKDDKFLNLAVDSKASCITTGDKDLLVLHPFQSVSIISPADFVNFF